LLQRVVATMMPYHVYSDFNIMTF